MKLPVVSGKDVLRVLLKRGYTVHNQKGSHIHLQHPEKQSVTVPNHKVIVPKTLKSIIEATGLTADDFR